MQPHLKVGNGAIITDHLSIINHQLLIDRGYTSYEHFSEVGIIHMNGRLYDPLLRRFLNADENIRDPHNTQNYNKYGYVMNNPLMYNDPNGEFFFLFLAPLMSAFWATVVTGAIIGAAIGLVTYSLGVALSGGKWSFGGALKSMFWGAVSGAVTAGIGNCFSTAASGYQAATEFAKTTLGAMTQTGAHAVAQGALSLMQGGSFQQVFLSAALGSLAASGFGAIAGDWAGKAGGQIFFGALSGGIGAELTGGNFWQGAVIGGIVAGLNHVLHEIYPPKGFKGKYWKDSDGEFTRNDDGSYNVTNSSEDVGKYREIDEITLYGKSKTRVQLENAANGIGINAETKEVIFRYAGKTGELSSTASKYLKYTEILGKVCGVYGAYSSTIDAYRNPTTGNILKATFNTGMLFVRVNPLVGLSIGILDATGVTNQVFNGIGNYINR